MPEIHHLALIIVDMQNDFVLPGSPVHVAGAQATIPSVRKLLDTARSRGWLVIHVVREYRRDASDVERPRAKDFLERGGYSISGTQGAGIVEELAPREGEVRIVKQRFSAFMQTELDLILRRLGVRHVVICGTQYPNCIRATAFDALSLDYEVTIVTSATSAQSQSIAEANIRDLQNVGIRCVSLEDFLDCPS
ncbi:MAG: cysteine hydrolase family protein [Leptospirales bacterium]